MARLDLKKFKKEEFNSPCPRKIDGERVIYTSKHLVPPVYRYNRPIFCDFGEARFGEYVNMDDIQPYQYCVLDMILTYLGTRIKDIWSVGVMVCTSVVWMKVNADKDKMWGLPGDGNLFRTT